MKLYPHNPTQIVNDRPWCRLNQSKDQKQSAGNHKCANCGIASEDDIRGSLLGLYERDDFKLAMAFVERVNCVNIQPSELKEEDGYYEKDGNYYHFISSLRIRGQHGGICYDERQINKEFDKRCYRLDLEAVHKMYIAFKNDPSNFIRNYHKNEIDFDYYAYHCPVSGLTEILIPIYSSSNKKVIIAVLIVGQLLIEDVTEGDEVVESPKDFRVQALSKARNTGDNVPKRNFNTANDMFDTYGKQIANFLNRMQDFIKLRVTNFLYAYQAERLNYFIIDKGDRHMNNKQKNSVRDGIVKLFKQVCVDFDLNHCLLFIPKLSTLDDGDEDCYLAYDVILGDSENPQPKLDISRLPDITQYTIPISKIVNNVCISDFIFDDKKVEQGYYEFYGNRDKHDFFGVLLEWNDLGVLESADGVNASHRGFFTALVNVCFAAVMARVAEIKKERLEAFAEETRHDLAQKMATLALHNSSFANDLKNFVSNGYKQSELDTFVHYCRIYHREMENIYSSLDFLRLALDTSSLTYEISIDEFHPYSRVLRNFNQHFNSPRYPYSRGKRLHLSQPDSTLPLINADPVMLERVLNNLIENAFKYAHDYTNIYLDYFFDTIDQAHKFKVTNYGPGIPYVIRDTIFMPGVRGEQIITGKGLGLSLATKFAEKHGGKVNLESGIIPESNITISNDKISEYYISLILLFEKGNLDKNHLKMKQISDLLQNEKDRLRHVKDGICALAKNHGKYNVYDEVVNQSGILDMGSVKPAMLGFLCTKETYRVTFTCSIPKNSTNRKDEPV